MTSNPKRWCYAWFQGKQAGAGQTKAALKKDSRWDGDGQTIKVAFMSGTEKLQGRVRDTALRWVAKGMANLNLQFINDLAGADVRIGFVAGDGSWSTVGTTCRQVPKNQATMNFGWIDENSSEEDLRSVVLHEFGHAIGLIHEHQNPNPPIQWNRAAVIASLSGPPNNWSVQEIEFNVLASVSPEDVEATARDSKSIMMYPFPANWTLDGFSSGFNSDLSDQDKKFIRKEYT